MPDGSVAPRDYARRAAAIAAAALVEPYTTLGLGSGRAVGAVVDALATQPQRRTLTVVCASSATAQHAHRAGLRVVEMKRSVRPQLVLDGADELTSGLELLKGGGGAHVRERLLILSAARFVVVAETTKVAARLGERRQLPLALIPFGHEHTLGALESIVPRATLRRDPAGNPQVSDDGLLLADAPVPVDADPWNLAERLQAIPGLVDHGLFLGLAHAALLGQSDGSVLRLPYCDTGFT